ncbi:hypothetical protein QBC37DRAFT_66193 [Rhypophila decipiens]|uniref:Secreted protein n=1 Tax=Rhypophila decipiens TaxID=261697 RepID=A0AAN6XZZ0_9PEZI|nr:hypothetical protein QBC37DRAFT_66193 [Rhypophila decipiens]
MYLFFLFLPLFLCSFFDITGREEGHYGIPRTILFFFYQYLISLLCRSEVAISFPFAGLPAGTRSETCMCQMEKQGARQTGRQTAVVVAAMYVPRVRRISYSQCDDVGGGGWRHVVLFSLSPKRNKIANFFFLYFLLYLRYLCQSRALLLSQDNIYCLGAYGEERRR